MRKMLFLMLLAGAASPAIAQVEYGPRGHRAERNQGDSDTQRPERPARQQRDPQANDGGTNNRPEAGNRQVVGAASTSKVETPQVDRSQHGSNLSTSTNVERGGRGQRRTEGETVRAPRQDTNASMESRIRKVGSHPTLPDRPQVERRNGVTESGTVNRNFRSGEHDGRNPASTIEGRNVRVAPNVHEDDGLVQPRRDTPRVVEPTERRVSRRPVFGTEPPAPRTAGIAQAHPSRRWNTDWRHDHRYDWNNWRRHHRKRFHLGFYYDPFGWDYFRYGVGWRMWPSYYGNSFWLNDPWQYRLPPAYGPYRWVRYHYDAVLVNIYTGQIADIVYDFFW